jgi:hypothetical protein
MYHTKNGEGFTRRLAYQHRQTIIRISNNPSIGKKDSKIKLFSPWYSWKIAELVLNYISLNHSKFRIGTRYLKTGC